jgi:hypothetical protein
MERDLRPISSNDLLDIFRKLKYFDTYKVSLNDVFLEAKEQYSWHPFYEISEESILNTVLTSNYTFTDTEYKDGYFKRIDYQPFKCLFETSGLIIIENDLRDYFQKPDKESYVDSTKGQIDCSNFYAKRGLLHGYVGNSCPNVFYSKLEETIVISHTKPDNSYELLTSITTDLWWYSICDVNTIESNYKTHTISSGLWELEHYYGINGFDNNCYAKLKLIQNG